MSTLTVVGHPQAGKVTFMIIMVLIMMIFMMIIVTMLMIFTIICLRLCREAKNRCGAILGLI